jgi:hypothetical protein
MMVDYVVWGSRPTGRVPAEKAAWLVTTFTYGEPTRNGVRIARAIVAEAQEVEPLRVCRRLLLLRGWSHDEENTPVFP